MFHVYLLCELGYVGEQPAAPGNVLERPTLSGTIEYTALLYVRDSRQKGVQLAVRAWDNFWETAVRTGLTRRLNRRDPQ